MSSRAAAAVETPVATGSTRESESFSWRAAVLGLLRPGRPPRAWVVTSCAIVLAELAAIVLLFTLGLRAHGEAWTHFKEGRAGTLLSVANLIACAVACFAIYRQLRPAHFRLFWPTASILFGLAALDDFFRLHESLSHAMSRWFGYRRRHQTLRHLDDVLVGLYGLGALAMAWYHRKPLLEMRWTVLCFALAGALFGVMVWLDLMRLSYALEDSLKILAGAVILAGLLHPLFADRPSRTRTARAGAGADSSAAPLR